MTIATIVLRKRRTLYSHMTRFAEHCVSDPDRRDREIAGT
jgi:hypothetical protein